MSDTLSPDSRHLHEEFFDTILRLGVLSEVVARSLPATHPFHLLSNDVIARLPRSMKAVSESLPPQRHSAAIYRSLEPPFMGMSDDEEEARAKSTNGDLADPRTPREASGSSLTTQPAPPPNGSNTDEDFDNVAASLATYKFPKLVPPTPPPQSNPLPSQSNPATPSGSTGPPTNMGQLSEVALGKRRVPFERADAFIETSHPKVFWDTQKYGCKDKFLFDQAKIPQEPTPPLKECVEAVKQKIRSVTARRTGAQNADAVSASASAGPSGSGPTSHITPTPSPRYAPESPPPGAVTSTPSPRYAPDSPPPAATASIPSPRYGPDSPPPPAATFTHLNASPIPKAADKGKKRAREEDEQGEHSVPTGASSEVGTEAGSTSDAADRRPTRKARTTKGSTSKASSSKAPRPQKTSRVSKFFRGEDVPSQVPKSESKSSDHDTKRFVAEEEGPRATYNGRPVVVIKSKYRSRSVEIPDDFTPEPPKEEPAPPAPVPAKSGAAKYGWKGKRGSRRKRAQEPEVPEATGSGSGPQLEGQSPQKKARHGSAQAQVGSQPGAGPSGSGAGAELSNSNLVAPEAPIGEPGQASQVGITAVRQLRRSVRQAKIVEAKGKGSA